MTMDQVLTLASMIEKEAKKADFAKVSAVFHNRLDQGMLLQSDPTVHYVTGERRMALRQTWRWIPPTTPTRSAACP